MKIAMLQCNTIVGDISGNANRILQAAKKAGESGASLCITPELALCGVSPRDLLSVSGFTDMCVHALERLAKELKNGPALLIGAPVPNPSQSLHQVSNAAVLLKDGEYRVISRKIYLGHGHSTDDSHYFDAGTTCGIITLEGWRIGVVLCEESSEQHSFWSMQHTTEHNPLLDIIRRGTDAVVHLAASPFYTGWESTREHVLSHAAARHHIYLFSVNAVGGNDEQIFAGRSVAFDPTGSVLCRGKAFEEDIAEAKLSLHNEQNTAEQRCSEEESCWNALVLGTRDYIHKNNCSKAVIGLSGGIDSALVCAIAAKALGAENVTGVLMPSAYTSKESLNDAALLAENLHVRTITLPIEQTVDAYKKVLAPVLNEFPASNNDTTFDNLQARVRGALLMAIANRTGALVLNTGNKSECAVGYCTLYGDAVGAVAVIGDVPKTMVYRISAWYNERHGKDLIPNNILKKEPTAELHPGQKDSDSLPPYDVLDPIISHVMGDTKTSDGETASIENEITSKIFKAEFKRRQGPIALQISEKPFGIGWSIPVTAYLPFSDHKNNNS